MHSGFQRRGNRDLYSSWIDSEDSWFGDDSVRWVLFCDFVGLDRGHCGDTA